MTNEEFDVVFNSIVEMCREIHRTKGQAYANGADRLANFKRLAEKKGVQPETILSIYGDKHEDAIDYVNRMIQETGTIPDTGEALISRFVDAINYHALNYALIVERQNRTVVVPETKVPETKP